MWRTRVESKTIRSFGVGLLALFSASAFMVGPVSAASRDADHDGMPNRWENAQGLDSHKANAAGDPDRDRLSNLAEYRHGAEPKDEDSDNDGIDDGDEVKNFDEFEVDDSDSNDNGVEDGDQDSNRDGDDNEDEDDPREECPADDDDRDEDGLDDEDENDFETSVRDSDSDDDGVEDGNEDSDDDGTNDEDSDDDSDDECESGGEDGDDVLGTIASFESGVLTVHTASGTVIAAPVTEDTEIEWDCEGKGTGGDGSVSDLVAGTKVADLELDEDTGALEEVELIQGLLE